MSCTSVITFFIYTFLFIPDSLCCSRYKGISQWTRNWCTACYHWMWTTSAWSL